MLDVPALMCLGADFFHAFLTPTAARHQRIAPQAHGSITLPVDTPARDK
jgi:hypothetical protein